MIPFLSTDVTAVCLHNGYIFAGIGSNVYVFDKNTSTLIKQIKALNGQKVHGFTSKTDCPIIVHGGKQIRILYVTFVNSPNGACELAVQSSKIIFCDDWILHTAWMKQDAVAALTAHNVVEIWNIGTCTLICKHASEDNSILYSGLLHILEEDVLVFAGTVFSKVIIHRCWGKKALQKLEGHKGVIFSIAWEAAKELIVSTSDDRSVRLWGSEIKSSYSPYRKKYWEECRMVCRHTVYGHLSRVMQSAITPEAIVSVGEDSNVCFWDFSGRLLRKLQAHQNGCIWCVSSDATHVVTGGSDGAVVLHPLTLALSSCQSDILHDDENLGIPKKIMFTARGHIVAYFSNYQLRYYTGGELNLWKLIHSYDITHKMISLSSCRQMVAVVDVYGNLDVFAESCKNSAELNQIIHKKLDLEKVYSMQWAGNRLLVVCSEGGTVTVVTSDCEELKSFCLPACKERWLTAAAVHSLQKLFVFGDRCGNLHFYHKELKYPLKTFKKIHGPYGPTTITWKNDSVITTGRDGTIKYFSVKMFPSETQTHNHCDKIQIKQMHQVHLPFGWIERLIREDIACGFSERNFVVYNTKDLRKIIDVRCGGGHRAWDINRYYQNCDGEFEEFIKFVYVKDSTVQQVKYHLDNITSKTILSGSHVKEINCLIMFPLEVNNASGAKIKEIFFIAGGEDTTLRVSSRVPKATGLAFSDRLILKQLSSIRTIAFCHLKCREILVVAGGGRAMISIKIINFVNCHPMSNFDVEAENVAEYQVNSLDKQRKSKNTWKSDADLDPDTRIMSLQVVRLAPNLYIILAGCSDSVFRMLKYIHGQEHIIQPYAQINYHKTCILKVHYMETSQHHVAFTITTTGETAIWNLSPIAESLSGDLNMDLSNMEPILKLNINKSGINSIAVNCTQFGSDWLVATGGDDNLVHLILLRFMDTSNLSTISEVGRWCGAWHCAQVTGLKFVDKYLISASIDQRITLGKCLIEEGVVKCEIVQQYYTDIADVQGLEVESRDGDSVVICVYGKGIEAMSLKIPSD